MQKILFLAAVLFVGIGTARSESLDEAVNRFLAGEKIDVTNIENLEELSKQAILKVKTGDHGAQYLNTIKLSIVYSSEDAYSPLNSFLVTDANSQKKTYLVIKAMYEKNKTPLLAYALVCPALYVDDKEILPELFAKIAENKPLKNHFDWIYVKIWKPRLDPDF